MIRAKNGVMHAVGKNPTDWIPLGIGMLNALVYNAECGSSGGKLFVGFGATHLYHPAFPNSLGFPCQLKLKMLLSLIIFLLPTGSFFCAFC
ncbi:MAG: hypothetical protein EAY75_07790 [Bacteroidetes bacterium]|nr:MAG: hypothetical protein EAY75_07790 [Bacteroidota bacterium]